MSTPPTPPATEPASTPAPAPTGSRQGDLWPAPTPSGPVTAVVSLPGSKSLTNRALVLAALADGPSVVRRALRSRDTLLMARALTALGAPVDTDGDDWSVTPLSPTGQPSRAQDRKSVV